LEKDTWQSPFFGVAITLVYALLMESLGYLLSTAVFIALWQLAISKSKPLIIACFTIGGTLVMYVLFELLLGVPLPNGLLRF
jgi:hypothetical protein